MRWKTAAVATSTTMRRRTRLCGRNQRKCRCRNRLLRLCEDVSPLAPDGGKRHAASTEMKGSNPEYFTLVLLEGSTGADASASAPPLYLRNVFKTLFSAADCDGDGSITAMEFQHRRDLQFKRSCTSTLRTTPSQSSSGSEALKRHYATTREVPWWSGSLWRCNESRASGKRHRTTSTKARFSIATQRWAKRE
mgnify:CR=1 FL=1